MEAVQLSQRRWLLTTLALAVVLASVDRTFTNYTSKVYRYPAIAAVSDSDVLEQPQNLGGDDDVDSEEEVEPYSDWEEAEREVSGLLEQTTGLEDMVRSRETVMDELDRAEMVEVIHLSLGQGQPRLKADAMRLFAEMTGFEGNDVEWSKEYALLCAEMDCSPEEGLTVAHLLRLVSDTSDLGTYYSDEELETICNILGAKPPLQGPGEDISQQEQKKVGKARDRSRTKSKSKKKGALRSPRRDPWA